MSSPSGTWGVEVNETAIHMHGAASTWWTVYRYTVLERAEVPLTTVESGPFGDAVFVPRPSRQSAVWLRDLAIRQGAQMLAVTVRQLANTEAATEGLTSTEVR